MMLYSRSHEEAYVQKAKELIRISINQSQEDGMSNFAAQTKLGLAGILFQLQEWDETETILQDCLDTFKVLHNVYMQAIVLGMLAMINIVRVSEDIGADDIDDIDYWENTASLAEESLRLFKDIGRPYPEPFKYFLENFLATFNSLKSAHD